MSYNDFMTNLDYIDRAIIHFAKIVQPTFGRIALFIVFFWFGILKVLGLSPASGLVEQLFERTVPFMTFGVFILLFGVFECIIGILFLMPKMSRLVILLLCAHMITTFGPLVFLPQETWQKFLVPTLEGQYIIKNLVIVALALGIVAHLTPMRHHKK